MRKRWFSILAFLVMVTLIPGLMFAQTTGKIRGLVLDSQTNDPLPGANVIVEGTSLGAVSDLNGEFVILNVPTGRFTVVCRFVGYETVTMRNLIVTQSLTTEANFTLNNTALAMGSITIVAERPLVNKNQTNEVHTFRAEDFDNMPVRGARAVIALQAGAVDLNGLHVRGGRSDETARYVDGVLVNLPLDGESGLSVVSNAIEEISYQAGGFTAEYGFANSGVVSTVTKTGGSQFVLSGEVITDDIFAVKSQNYQWLGLNDTYSWGYNDYILTLSGPVPILKNLKFFVAGQRAVRADDATFFEGFHQDSLEYIGNYTRSNGSKFSDTLNLFLDMPAGRDQGGHYASNMFNANLSWDRKPFRIKVGGSYATDRSQDCAVDPGNLYQENFYQIPSRGRLFKNTNSSAYVRMTHLVDPRTFYTLNLNYFYNFGEAGDPFYWDNLVAYGNPTLNNAMADTGIAKSIKLYGFQFNYPNQPQANYSKNEQGYYGGKLDLTHQMGRHELKTGGEFNYYTIRRYSVTAEDLLGALAAQKKSIGTAQETTDYDVYYSLFLRNYGYDIYGKQIDKAQTYQRRVGGQLSSFNGEDAPKHPILAAYYLQDKVELKDLVINAGVRVDYFTTGTKALKDLSAITQGASGTIDASNWEKARTYTEFTPRLGFSFPVTDLTVFHAQFGKFVQMPRFDVLFGRGYGEFSNFLYAGGYAVVLENPNLKPERTTSYEFGFQQQFGLSASLDLTAFYKDTRDLATLRVIIPTIPDYRAPYFTMNQDFGTIKGLSATFNLRRSARVQVFANYTLSFAQGTGSAQDAGRGSHFDIAWQEETPVFPMVIAPLDYDQRHKGTINIDIRTQPDDGPMLLGSRVLGNVGLNLLLTYHSGNPFTRIAQDGKSEVFGYNGPFPVEGYNQSTMPWVYNLDLKLDKSVGVGPVNFDVYLWVLNVLNRKNITGVFRPSGDPQNDGYLQTDAGKKWAKTYADADNAIMWYNAIQSLNGTRSLEAPRQIRLGVRFEFK